MKAINEYKALIEDISRTISCYANYKLWPPEIVQDWSESALLQLYNRLLHYNPADIKESIIGDGKFDEFAGRLKTARFELDMKPTFAPTYYPAFDNDLFSNERNPEMYNALISINGKDWAFRVMDRLRLIAMIANTKIEDVCNTLDEIDVFINNKTAKATPGATANTDLSRLGDYFNAKFKGSGNNPNYLDELICDVEKLKTSKELAMVALMIFNNNNFIKKPSTFAAWLRTFFEIIGRECPKDTSKNKYEPSNMIKRTFYYLA